MLTLPLAYSCVRWLILNDLSEMRNGQHSWKVLLSPLGKGVAEEGDTVKEKIDDGVRFFLTAKEYGAMGR